jgi:hypothetical protein
LKVFPLPFIGLRIPCLQVFRYYNQFLDIGTPSGELFLHAVAIFFDDHNATSSPHDEATFPDAPSLKNPERCAGE